MSHRDSSSIVAAREALGSLFDDLAVAVETASPVPDLSALYPEERSYVACALPKRQAEFATSRACARAALSRLEFPRGPLVPWPDRSPRWPAGAVGSITHSEGVCAVVVARSTTLKSIGIDVESAAPLAADLERLICTPAERRLLDAQQPPERGRTAKLLFSAKEAFYKCQYPLTKTLLDFTDVEIDFDSATASFSARLPGTAAPRQLEAARGRWTWIEGFVITRALLLA